MKTKYHFFIFVFLFQFVTSSAQEPKFLEVKINNQVWMTQNLNEEKFQNGDFIPEAKTITEWKMAAINGQPAWCYYNNDPVNGARYGKLYNWYAVKDPRGLAPKGWRVASNEDWTQLRDFLGGYINSSKKLKPSGDSGFSGLLGGERNSYGYFFKEGDIGCWWSSNRYNTINALFFKLDFSYFLSGNRPMGDGLSVRCVRDAL